MSICTLHPDVESRSHVAVTAHWINFDFKLNEALLCFEKLVGTHSGRRMAEKLFHVLEDFDITAKLFCITTDAAANNTTLVRSLSEILLDEKGIDWDSEKMHINCLDHVINVAVQAFLRSIKVVASTDTDDEEGGDVDIMDGPDGSCASTMSKLGALAKVHPFVSCKMCLEKHSKHQLHVTNM